MKGIDLYKDNKNVLQEKWFDDLGNWIDGRSYKDLSVWLDGFSADDIRDVVIETIHIYRVNYSSGSMSVREAITKSYNEIYLRVVG